MEELKAHILELLASELLIIQQSVRLNGQGCVCVCVCVCVCACVCVCMYIYMKEGFVQSW